MKYRMKSQGWSLDFILGLLMFMLAIILTIKFITAATSGDEFDELFDEAKYISDQLRSDGYPMNWTSDSFVRIGLLTDGKFDDDKFRNFTTFTYANSKRYINTRFEYYIILEDSYGKFFNISGNCGYGSPIIETKPNPNMPAYYISDNTEIVMMPTITTPPYNARGYVANLAGQGIEDLIDALDNDTHNFVLMENPRLNRWTTYDEEHVVGVIQNWTAKGNILILSQSVYINSSFLGMNFSPGNPNATGDASVVSAAYFNLTDADTIDFEDKSTFTPKNPSNYEVLANYSDHPAIATWTYGNGRVFYFSDFNLNSNYDGQADLVRWVDYGLPELVYAYCEGVNESALDMENIVKLQRIVPRQQGIAKMNIYVWWIADE